MSDEGSTSRFAARLGRAIWKTVKILLAVVSVLIALWIGYLWWSGLDEAERGRLGLIVGGCFFAYVIMDRIDNITRQLAEQRQYLRDINQRLDFIADLLVWMDNRRDK